MLKLAKLPDRTPVKLTINILPQLSDALTLYAKLYADTYGQSASVPDLVPFMLQSFLDSDREFARARQQAQAKD